MGNGSGRKSVRRGVLGRTAKARADLEAPDLLEALELSGEGVLSLNAEGQVLYANAQAQQLLGDTSEGWLTGVHPEDRARAQAAWKSAVGARRRFERELRLRRQDGSYAQVVVRATPRMARTGVVREWLTTLTDVSAQRRTEATLRFIVEASGALTELLDDPEATLLRLAQLVARTLADYCIIDVIDDDATPRRAAVGHRDPARAEWAKEMLAYPPALSLRSPVQQVIRTGQPLISPRWTADDQRRAAHDAKHLALMQSVRVQDLLVVPMKARGRLFGVISLWSEDPHERYGHEDLVRVQDLAQRAVVAVENARLFRAAQSAEQQARFLADAANALSASLDYNGTLRTVVELCVPTLGDWAAIDVFEEDGSLRRAAVAHRDPRKVQLLHILSQRYPADIAQGIIQEQAMNSLKPRLTAEVVDADLRRVARDEEQLRLIRAVGMAAILVVPMAVRGRALGVLTLVLTEVGRRYRDEDVRLAQELTRRASLSVENARLYQNAQAAIRRRDEFLSVASHELKTPLTPLSLRLQQLLKEAAGQPDSPLAQKLLAGASSLRKQVQRMTELINSLLDVSRIVEARLRLVLEVVDLSALVRETVGRLAPQAAQAGCELKLSLAEGLKGEWDRMRLEQVITNLLSNAFKYGPGRPIELETSRADAFARLTVRDHGIGIAAEHLPRIFGRFERAVSERNYGGLGLGLYISRQLVEAMGGRIGVKTRVGEGALFWVELPMAGL